MIGDVNPITITGSGFFSISELGSRGKKAQNLGSGTMIFLSFIFAVLNPDADPLTPLNPNPIRVRVHNTG
jgi:hypothetical protein